MHRRSFLLGATAALAAPAVVKAESLMRIAQLRRFIGVGVVTGIDDDGVSVLLHP